METKIVVRRKGEPEFSEELQHWKYIKKKKVNGKWRYYYDVKDALGFDEKARMEKAKQDLDKARTASQDAHSKLNSYEKGKDTLRRSLGSVNTRPLTYASDDYNKSKQLLDTFDKATKNRTLNKDEQEIRRTLGANVVANKFRYEDQNRAHAKMQKAGQQKINNVISNAKNDAKNADAKYQKSEASYKKAVADYANTPLYKIEKIQKRINKGKSWLMKLLQIN